MPIMRQILTPRRGTKRRPDARARTDGGCRKRARNVAYAAEVAADKPGEEGDAGEQKEDKDFNNGDGDNED